MCKVRTLLYSYKFDLKQVDVSASYVAVIRMNIQKNKLECFSAAVTDLRSQKYNVIVTEYIHIKVHKIYRFRNSVL